MKITQLTVENHKRIRAATVTPDGNMVIIGGENGEGKSSLIESIETLLRGKRAICKDPVHHGADKAIIIGKFDNGLIVTKEITPDGNAKLVIRGNVSSTPQALLDSFYSEFSFDPDKFFNMGGQKRLETLGKIVKSDFTELDEQRKQVYEDRAQAGRDVSGRQSQIDQMAEYAGVPAKEVSIGELMAELNAAVATEDRRKKLDDHVAQLYGAMQEEEKKVANARQAIAQWQRAIDMAREKCSAIGIEYGDAVKTARSAAVIDTAPIQAKIDALEDTNRKVRANINRRELRRSFASKKADYERLTQKLNAIDAKKADMLSKAKFPIKGLSFGEGDVEYNGVTFDQASQAEKLRVVIAMNIALNPELRAICVRTASLLDAKNMKILADLADEFDTQIWAERVGQGEECSVIIEDGMVKKSKIKE